MNAMTPLPDIVRKPARPLRVTMLGLRGFPDVQGGVEHHVQHLACALANLGCDVEAVMRSPYVMLWTAPPPARECQGSGR
jgi:hypothetical protein